MNIVLLTGRGGSKSIASKNVYPILGRPLAYYPMNAAKSAKKVDKVFVTTDSQDIISLAREMDIEVIKRPEELSQDNSELVDAIIHAVDQMNVDINYLITMHCNCAIHPEGLIDKCIEIMDKNPEADSCVTGYSDQSIHPFRTKKINEQGYLENWLETPEAISSNRQSLEPCFVLDGAARVMRYKNCFPPSGYPPFAYLGKKIRYFENGSVGDIHGIDDIISTELALRDMGWKPD